MSTVLLLKGGKWGDHRPQLVQNGYAIGNGSFKLPLRRGETLVIFRGVKGGKTDDKKINENSDIVDVDILGSLVEGEQVTLGKATGVLCPPESVMGMRDAMKGLPFVLLQLCSDGCADGESAQVFTGEGREVTIGTSG